jgi:hypothetical protein
MPCSKILGWGEYAEHSPTNTTTSPPGSVHMLQHDQHEAMPRKQCQACNVRLCGSDLDERQHWSRAYGSELNTCKTLITTDLLHLLVICLSNGCMHGCIHPYVSKTSKPHTLTSLQSLYQHDTMEPVKPH